MSRTSKNSSVSWDSLADADAAHVRRAALAAVAEDSAAKLASRGQSALLLAACALVDKRDQVKAAFAALEHDEAEEEVLVAWEKGGLSRALLIGAALRFGWELPAALRDLLLAELDVVEPGDEIVEDLALGLERVSLTAPQFVLAGGPICSEAIIEALDRCTPAVQARVLDGYAALLGRRGLEQLPEPADVHGIMVHDLLASSHGEHLLERLAGALGVSLAGAAAGLLRATMQVAIDPHATEGYVSRRATGQGEVVDEAMLRGIFEHLQIEYDDVGAERWSLVVLREDELGESVRFRVMASLTAEHVVVAWPEPMPTPTEAEWWPDLLHRNRALGLARFQLDDAGRLTIAVVQRREGFELSHFAAAMDALHAAVDELLA